MISIWPECRGSSGTSTKVTLPPPAPPLPPTTTILTPSLHTIFLSPSSPQHNFWFRLNWKDTACDNGLRVVGLHVAPAKIDSICLFSCVYWPQHVSGKGRGAAMLEMRRQKNPHSVGMKRATVYSISTATILKCCLLGGCKRRERGASAGTALQTAPHAARSSLWGVSSPRPGVKLWWWPLRLISRVVMSDR